MKEIITLEYDTEKNLDKQLEKLKEFLDAYFNTIKREKT